jgi:hypothetical protein
MPAAKHHRQRDRRSNNPGYKIRVRGAWPPENTLLCEKLHGKKEVVMICSSSDSSHIALTISRSALSDGVKNHHVSFTESSQHRQMLASEEEQVLLDWFRQRAQESPPQELCTCAHEISGKTISKKTAHEVREVSLRNP